MSKRFFEAWYQYSAHPRTAMAAISQSNLDFTAHGRMRASRLSPMEHEEEHRHSQGGK
jgi:hypothetical protein